MAVSGGVYPMDHAMQYSGESKSHSLRFKPSSVGFWSGQKLLCGACAIRAMQPSEGGFTS
ncbi:uncharacterized protein N7529_007159 [Penicillium soppii]|uniref:uncharacterized protein n=1 Tax=Penicillium soppii TaxID=69789 RepID=UPI002547D0FF|nr:uncharacterized protein N7529_007159 [Penicillium soppii]KAJ5865243.1 hypothetical protein N7529_007159 [Penicillium soppii]